MIIKVIKIVNLDDNRVVETEVVKAKDNYELSAKVSELLLWWNEAKANYCGYKANYDEDQTRG